MPIFKIQINNKEFLMVDSTYEKALSRAEKLYEEQIIKNIKICSGYAGLEEYKNSNTEDFLQWFEANIQFNTEDSKTLGYETIQMIKQLSNK